MPVTLTVNRNQVHEQSYLRATTPEALLERASPHDFGRCHQIIQTSFSRPALEENYISASKNGFVLAAYDAYSRHHHLTIRPDDIWLAIVTQLGFYINANAEKLRPFFVHHEGQKDLEVVQVSADFGHLAECMTHLIAENVKDPELRTWVMPAFSTTTDTDRVVASVLFMGAMKTYFGYRGRMACGIPSVTLLGEVADYEDILARLDKLEQLGDEPTQFAHMLRPILRFMIMSFSHPTNPNIVSLWNRIATRDDSRSGFTYISGWLTAFCYWNPEGEAKRLTDQYDVFEGVSYPNIDLHEVPSGFATVPVVVNDNGIIHNCTMLAGSLGIQALPKDEDMPQKPSGVPSTEGSQPALTRVRSLAGWIVYENESTSSKS